MSTRDIRQIRAALEVVRESEALLMNLSVSMSSVSSVDILTESGLESYLKATKRSLRVSLAIGWMRLTCVAFSKATFTVLRAWWTRMIRKSRQVA
ncbi:MAG: hypothetical protein JW883_16555 [Deltaproteobacteria bacterium]|nr:hypothetical protein [Deltaproteobacteria bacterium]